MDTLKKFYSYETTLGEPISDNFSVINLAMSIPGKFGKSNLHSGKVISPRINFTRKEGGKGYLHY